MSSIMWLEEAAKVLHQTPGGLISHIIRGYRFSNEDDVINQRLREYREGYVAEYILAYCVAVVRQNGGSDARQGVCAHELNG